MKRIMNSISLIKWRSEAFSGTAITPLDKGGSLYDPIMQISPIWNLRTVVIVCRDL